VAERASGNMHSVKNDAAASVAFKSNTMGTHEALTANADGILVI
jgi:hypothetical protein